MCIELGLIRRVYPTDKQTNILILLIYIDKKMINLPEEYEIDQFTRKRNNQDIHINSYGEKLIDFSISTKMRILNGRTLGDFQGKVTYIGYNGVRTIDYILASEIFLMRKYIHSFNVEELTSLSDHSHNRLFRIFSVNRGGSVGG